MKWKIYLAVTAIFFLGMTSGALLVAQVIQSKIASVSASSTEELSEIVLEYLQKELRLTGEQRPEVVEILNEAAATVEPLRTEMRARAAEIFQKNSGRIAALLDAKQQRRLDRLVRVFSGRWNLQEWLN